MFADFLKKIFGSRNDRLLRQYRKVVAQINGLEATIASLSDEALRLKTEEFKTRFQAGETLDALLPEAFAVVREAGKRVLGMRHFDVQLVGGMALHAGKIAEMRTGEGKTLVSTLPAYLNALSGKPVHVVTVNDYLARRDAEWMGKIHRFLGLSVGVNLSQMPTEEKRAAFASDITYGTNNEFGFDYLRDNMVQRVEDRVMRGLVFAIVDEVDSILIDEARTPLIISGQADDNTALYKAVNGLIPKLVPQSTEEGEGDYWVDLKQHAVLLSELGHEKSETLMTEAGLLAPGASLYDSANIVLMHHLMAGLRAHALYHRDQHYVLSNGEIVIVDEFTGRMMPGRRWSEGLHQAVEAKEGVKVQAESQTLASITFQNFFRMYAKLSGMTGTADTEAFEFSQIYNLETVLIPPHRPMVRADKMDQVFRSNREKFNAILADIRECHGRGQPVLVGTTSIENSELLSEMLQKEALPHQVLNAKQHAREAEIVAQAGRPGMITIATNMAGRGTDIVLGGSPEADIGAIESNASLSPEAKTPEIEAVKNAWSQRHRQVVQEGGLHIVGSERHESRRIDNQLRGRAGRQGDPGSSRFYLSLEDPLLKIFASDRVAAIMDRLNMPEGEAIEHPWVTRAIENAQRKVEARNFDIRKQLLEYDDVANDQRKVIYAQRNELLEAEDISATIGHIRKNVIEMLFREYIPAEAAEELWDIPGLKKALLDEYGLDLPLEVWLSSESSLDEEAVIQRIADTAKLLYDAKFAGVDPVGLHGYERAVMLHSIDGRWREHLAALDYLRQGIHLRGYAQKNPKQEYKREAFELFSGMLDHIKREVTRILMQVQVATAADVEEKREQELAKDAVTGLAYHAGGETLSEDEPAAMIPRVGRNDPCPCGSGKKYKQCHGRLS